MTPLLRRQLVAALLGIVTGVMALLIVFVSGPRVPPSSRWVTYFGAGLAGVMAVVMFVFVVLFGREPHATARQFVPLHPGTGRSQVPTSPLVERLAWTLHQRLAGSPYHILTAGDAVRVEWNTGDLRYRSLLTDHELRRVFRTTLYQVEEHKVLPITEMLRWDARRNILSAAGSFSFSEGSHFRWERRTDVAVTPDGAQLGASYQLDSRIISQAVSQAISSTGASTRRNLSSLLGIITAVVLGGGMMVFGVLVANTMA